MVKCTSLGIKKVVLAYFNIVNTDYQHDSRILHIFAPNKLFGQILDVSPKNFSFLKKKILNSELSYIELWFTDQKSTLLEIEDKINGTLVIN